MRPSTNRLKQRHKIINNIIVNKNKNDNNTIVEKIIKMVKSCPKNKRFFKKNHY
jgi:hypothetical protein